MPTTAIRFRWRFSSSRGASPWGRRAAGGDAAVIGGRGCERRALWQIPATGVGMKTAARHGSASCSRLYQHGWMVGRSGSGVSRGQARARVNHAGLDDLEEILPWLAVQVRGERFFPSQIAWAAVTTTAVSFRWYSSSQRWGRVLEVLLPAWLNGRVSGERSLSRIDSGQGQPVGWSGVRGAESLADRLGPGSIG